MSESTAGELLVTIDHWLPILLGLDDDTVRHKPSPDRWTISEVIGHLVDSACNNHQRFVRAQGVDELTFPDYDQNAWAIAGDYCRADWPSLVTLWHAYNQHLAQVMRRIPADKRQTLCTITPHETCTLGFLVDDYVVHLRHHLDKIKERLEAQS